MKKCKCKCKCKKVPQNCCNIVQYHNCGPFQPHPPAPVPVAKPRTNGDLERYANQGHISAFKKGIIQDKNSIEEFRNYLKNNDLANMKKIIKFNLIDPSCANHCEDKYKFLCEISRIPPTIASEEFALCMLELYLMYLMRDVPFREFKNHKLYNDFINKYPLYNFIGESKCESDGYYISQFLLLRVPVWCASFDQKIKFYKQNIDYLGTVEKFEACYFENVIEPNAQFEDIPRYCITGRDLATIVHNDSPTQLFDYALIILFSSYASAFISPYPQFKINGFIDFGRAGVELLVKKAAIIALRCAWWYKFNEHLYLRPEEAAYNIEKNNFPINSIINDLDILKTVKEKNNGHSILPIAYKEGCPKHASFPSGHATIGGACITILKAFFDENYQMKLKYPTNDGLALVDSDDTSTIGCELNKLASNVGIGRNFAGIHYRFDAIMGIECGEDVAIHILKEYKDQLKTDHIFKFTRYNGIPVQI